MKNNFWAKSNGVSLGQHIADVLQGIEILRQGGRRMSLRNGGWHSNMPPSSMTSVK